MGILGTAQPHQVWRIRDAYVPLADAAAYETGLGMPDEAIGRQQRRCIAKADNLDWSRAPTASQQDMARCSLLCAM